MAGGGESIYFKYNLILPEPRGHISKPIKKHCLVNCKMKLYTLNSSEDLELCWLFSVDVLRLALRVIEPATSTLNAWINQSINQWTFVASNEVFFLYLICINIRFELGKF